MRTTHCGPGQPARGRKSHLQNILVWEEVALVDYVSHLYRRKKDSSDPQGDVSNADTRCIACNLRVHWSDSVFEVYSWGQLELNRPASAAPGMKLQAELSGTSVEEHAVYDRKCSIAHRALTSWPHVS